MKPDLFLLFILPLLTGTISLFFKGHTLSKGVVLLSLVAGLLFSIFLLFTPLSQTSFYLAGDYTLNLGLNILSRMILLFVNLFGFLICLYSGTADFSLKDSRLYFAYLSWLIAFSNLICLAGDFILFIFGWGATLAILYAFLNLTSGESANKALTVVGFGDFSLILGICLYIHVSGNTLMPERAGIGLGNFITWLSFILMLAAAFAKAGCGPLHTWIPTASQTTSPAVMALLPASLDKLLGIYLLARICQDFFILNNTALGLLLIIGALTILFAVLMALIQHDLRKLLAYHAISQVGYMVLGFGTGNILGVAGGLFHMINNAIYKCGLFLTGGAAADKRRTFDLESLGSLAAYMPVTFVCGLVFALSISGIPPFNGFASKWMLYQGTLVGLFNTSNGLMRFAYLFALISAMFGSTLTLASFIKFIHAIFLGEDKTKDNKGITEVVWWKRVSVLVLASLCLLLGVLPRLVLNNFIQPWLGQRLEFLGSWDSGLAFLLLAIGLFIGIILGSDFLSQKMRRDSCFTGGEQAAAGLAFPATEFYRTIEKLSLIQRIYWLLKIEALDFYNILKSSLNILSARFFILIDRFIDIMVLSCGYIILGFGWILRRLHTGVLDFYLVWSLIGLLVLFYILR